MRIPGLSYDLIKELDLFYPARHATPRDFRDEESKARFLMYAGKRELIESLLRQIEDPQIETILNRKE